VFFTGSNRIGLGSEITDELGGLETFFVTNIAGAGGGGAGGGEVPEPVSLILIGGGLLVLGFMRKNKVSTQ